MLKSCSSETVGGTVMLLFPRELLPSVDDVLRPEAGSFPWLLLWSGPVSGTDQYVMHRWVVLIPDDCGTFHISCLTGRHTRHAQGTAPVVRAPLAGAAQDDSLGRGQGWRVPLPARGAPATQGSLGPARRRSVVCLSAVICLLGTGEVLFRGRPRLP